MWARHGNLPLRAMPPEMTHCSLPDDFPHQIVLQGPQVSPPLPCGPFSVHCSPRSCPAMNRMPDHGGGATWWCFSVGISLAVPSASRSSFPRHTRISSNFPHVRAQFFPVLRWPRPCSAKQQDTESTPRTQRKQRVSSSSERLPVIHNP